MIEPAGLPNRGFFDQPKKQKHQQRSPPVPHRYQRTTRSPAAWNQGKRERSSHQNTDFIENNFHAGAIETVEKQRLASLSLVRTGRVSSLHRSTGGRIEPQSGLDQAACVSGDAQPWFIEDRALHWTMRLSGFVINAPITICNQRA